MLDARLICLPLARMLALRAEIPGMSDTIVRVFAARRWKSSGAMVSGAPQPISRHGLAARPMW